MHLTISSYQINIVIVPHACIISPERAAGGVEAPLDLVNALHHELPEPLKHPPLDLARVEAEAPLYEPRPGHVWPLAHPHHLLQLLVTGAGADPGPLRQLSQAQTKHQEYQHWGQCSDHHLLTMEEQG